ncbi:MAG: DUF1028 domain-containing protein, partial [Acidobacteriota bacterium]
MPDPSRRSPRSRRSTRPEPAGLPIRRRARGALSAALVGLLAFVAAPAASTAPAPSAAPAATATAADGVPVDAEGRPFYATFSLCALDPETGELGVAVTTRVPFVGRAVPWVRAGVGAVATQAWTVVEYGVRGLDLMEAGVAPADALEQLL